MFSNSVQCYQNSSELDTNQPQLVSQATRSTMNIPVIMIGCMIGFIRGRLPRHADHGEGCPSVIHLYGDSDSTHQHHNRHQALANLLKQGSCVRVRARHSIASTPTLQQDQTQTVFPASIKFRVVDSTKRPQLRNHNSYIQGNYIF